MPTLTLRALRGPKQLLIAIAVGSALLPSHAANAQTGPPAPRPRVGVALGGGSARGLAHVGVLRWLEEHHVPIDVLSGTSMGGLIGGAYATGMTPDEVEDMLAAIDWSAMFGSSDFRFQNVRRKRDSRDYPSHLEFGFKNGLSVQSALNSGQQVDLLLSRITASYHGLVTFDDLPTPFRCVAFDLRTAQKVVLDRGSLSSAMRATMSLPAVFPPVVVGNQVLVDGGAVDNIPADVVRDMGASVVVAVNVGDLTDPAKIPLSLFGVASGTMDSMMRANTMRELVAADIVVNVPLEDYGSLDWRRFRELIREGYEAAEALKPQLLPLAVSEEDWQMWRAGRDRLRRRTLPPVTFVDVQGASSSDASVMRQALLGQTSSLDLDALEASITELGGLGRYQAVTWEIIERDNAYGLQLTATPKSYAPPFLFLGLSLENTTSDSFRFGLSGRYLTFDVLGSGSELRLDAAVGSDPSAAAALYEPVWQTPFFVEPSAGVASRTLNVIDQNEVVASYGENVSWLAADAGVNLGRLDEIRMGIEYGHISTTVRVGDPGLPELKGTQSRIRTAWTHDSQDSPVVPSTGAHAVVELRHYLTAPSPGVSTSRSTEGVSQSLTAASWFLPLDPASRNRLFLSGGAGTSFSGHPLPPEQFSLGGPLRLSALNVGEVRGDHFLLATGGYLREIGRLPDFIGGPVALGGWLENGSAYDDWDTADFHTNISVGVIAETLVGPVFVGFSAGLDGSKRFYLGVGRIFR